jgi:transcriptional regulator with XRE-family HTH domain
MDQTPSTLGTRIAEARRAAGYSSAAKFARQVLDIDPSVLWLYENDQREPRTEVLARIATACGTTIDWLVLGRGAAPKPEPMPLAPPNPLPRSA